MHSGKAMGIVRDHRFPIGWLYASSGEGRLRIGDNLWPGALRRRSRLIVCCGRPTVVALCGSTDSDKPSVMIDAGSEWRAMIVHGMTWLTMLSHRNGDVRGLERLKAVSKALDYAHDATTIGDRQEPRPTSELSEIHGRRLAIVWRCVCS